MSKGTTDKKAIFDNNDIEYKISNVVASVSFSIDEKLDLLKVLDKIEATKYNPEIFPGLILKLKNPKATFLIFSSGKMILTGLSDVSNSDKAVEKLINKLKKVKIHLKDPEIKIRNIVATVDLHSFINLNKAAIIMENVMYEPEVFPGLVYYMEDPNAVFLIFSTGKLVCTKTKTKAKLLMAISKLREKLKELKLLGYESQSYSDENDIFI